MTGTTDFKEIVENANLDHPPPMESGNHKSDSNPYTLAFHLFLDRILDHVGAYHLKLRANVDALVFSGGIGEHSPQLREAIGKAVECLSYQPIDPEKNRAAQSQSGCVVDIGLGDRDPAPRKGRVLVCRTDEQVCWHFFTGYYFDRLILHALQFEMARECAFTDHLW